MFRVGSCHIFIFHLPSRFIGLCSGVSGGKLWLFHGRILLSLSALVTRWPKEMAQLTAVGHQSTLYLLTVLALSRKTKLGHLGREMLSVSYANGAATVLTS